MLLSLPSTGHPQIPWDPHGATAACPMGRELQAQDTHGRGLQSPRHGNSGQRGMFLVIGEKGTAFLARCWKSQLGPKLLPAPSCTGRDSQP